MDHREFLDWCAFNKLSPIGDIRNDYYFAAIAAEVRRGFVKDPKKVKNKDFLIFKRPTIQEYKFSKLSESTQKILKPFIEKFK